MLLQGGLLDWERKSVGLTTNKFKDPKTGDCQSDVKGKKMTEEKIKGRELKWLRRRAHIVLQSTTPNTLPAHSAPMGPPPIGAGGGA